MSAASAYRAVWRWHFYAGLFCIPFIVFLSVTGAMYLFKPQVEAWLDRPYDTLTTVQSASPSQVVQAALAAYPGYVFNAYELPQTPQSAARVLIGHEGKQLRVYVDRSNLHILQSVSEDQRVMKVISRLHGELLAGDIGSNIVELAASWAIVMILTGLYLWWPRGARGLGGILYPRLNGNKRQFWRDIHGVTGFWVSAFALFMLVSGLPWAKNWGGYLKDIRQMTGTTNANQDWTTGRSSEIAQRKSMDAAGAASMGTMPGMARSGGDDHSDHAEHRSHRYDGIKLSPEALKALDRVTPIVAALNLAYPVLISPPSKLGAPWKGKSDAQNRPLRVDLKLDPKTGAVVGRTDFAQRNIIDRIVGTAVAAHEGQLFGWANQLLGLLTALSLITVSISAVVMWWRRRAIGVLGAPAALGHSRFSLGLWALVTLIGVLLPEFGLSLIAVVLGEYLVLRRIPATSKWLGLEAARA